MFLKLPRYVVYLTSLCALFPSTVRPEARRPPVGINTGQRLESARGPASGQAKDSAEDLFREAQAARARGDLASAESKYRKLIRIAPGMANAYHNLGLVYLAEHKYKESAEVLEKAAKLEPKEPATWFLEGLAYYELYESRKAVAALQTALRLRPSDENAQLYLGKAQIQMRDYRGAAATLEKLSRSRPDDASVLYNLGIAHMKLMLGDVDRLTAVAPQSYLLSLLLAQDAETRGDEDAAARFYQEALRVNSSAAGVHYALGSIYANSGKNEEAVREFQDELKINPNDSLALWKLGEVTLRLDARQASEYLQDALKLDPDLPQARLAYGRALVRLGQLNQAVEQFQQVERLAPEEDSVHYHLANAYRRLGQEEQAKVELARFEKLAKEKSQRIHDVAQRQIELSRDAQQDPNEPQPGFDTVREPVHH
jgi:tetratricopeptide (TPR) repeat protein